MAQAERQREERARGGRNGDRRGKGKRAAAAAEYEFTPYTCMCINALSVAFAIAGGALRVGLTRDKGALALGCYYGDDYATEYVRPSEDILHAVTEIAAAWLPGGEADLQYGFNAVTPRQQER